MFWGRGLGCWGLGLWKKCRKVNKVVLYNCYMVVKKGRRGRRIGRWAFLIGVVLAIVFAIIGRMTPEVVGVLVFIGFIVGLLSVTDEESQPFLMSGTVLIIASAFGQNALLAFDILDRMFSALLVIFVPATIVVAVRNVFGIATS